MEEFCKDEPNLGGVGTRKYNDFVDIDGTRHCSDTSVWTQEEIDEIIKRLKNK
jgi:hypothetical protein